MTELESRSSHVSVIIAPIFLGMDLVRELSQEDNTVNIVSAMMSIGMDPVRESEGSSNI
jgi:hypothetical protein